jgi:predicted nucleotidyltransferase
VKGIQPHTHLERLAIVSNLLLQIKQRYGKNLLAVAADGSFARNEDQAYSDLEIIVFVKKFDATNVQSVRKIIDGQLIEIIPETKESFIEKYLEVSEVWYASGAGKLSAIWNEKLIDEINAFEPQNVELKCWMQAQKKWIQYQEITAKLLNEIEAGNRAAVPMIFVQMVKDCLVLMSYINMTPYTTLGSYVFQANQFDLRPKGFEELMQIHETGEYDNLKVIETVTQNVFTGFEQLYAAKGIDLYRGKIEDIFNE